MLWRRRNRTSGKRRRGAALVEAALVLPLCMLFIYGIMEYGRYLLVIHVLNNAAREGVRYAVSHSEPVTIDGVTYGNSTSDVTNVVTTFSAGQSLAGQTVQVYLSDTVGNNLGVWTDAESGESICVSISGNFKMIVPSLLRVPANIPVTIRASMRTESN